MESWRLVWREGFAPVLSTPALIVLRDALRSDDPRLIQRATVLPLMSERTKSESVECACALGFCGWQADALATVEQVDEFFGRCCFEADQRLGEPASCRWFLNWVDAVSREEMRRELLAEVELVLAAREAKAA